MDYEFCKKHNAPLTEIAGQTFCMHDWLEDLSGHRVVDVAMPAEDDGKVFFLIRVKTFIHVG